MLVLGRELKGSLRSVSISAPMYLCDAVLVLEAAANLPLSLSTASYIVPRSEKRHKSKRMKRNCKKAKNSRPEQRYQSRKTKT